MTSSILASVCRGRRCRPREANGFPYRTARRARERAFAFLVAQPNFDQAIGKLVCDLVQCQEISRARRTFDFEIVAVVMMKLLERLNQQIIDWKPNRAAPV